MSKLVPFAALLLLAAGGCGSGDGDRGQTAPPEALNKPLTEEQKASMPPQARQAAEQSMAAGQAMKEQLDKRYGNSGH